MTGLDQRFRDIYVALGVASTRLSLADFADYTAAAEQLAELRTRCTARVDERTAAWQDVYAAEREGRGGRPVQRLRERCRELDTEIKGIDDAIAAATRELERVRTLHVSEIRDSARGAHEALVQEIAALAIRLTRLSDREYALRVEVEQNGAPLPVLGVPVLGSLRDRDSWVARYLEECTRLGYDVTTATRTLETYRATPA